MKTITRDQLKQKLDDDDQDIMLVEVLGPDHYDSFHLPGAINVPYDDRFENRIRSQVPDRAQPVVVYCLDEDCDASVKAAHAMAGLGYEQVYDYEAGKVDWKQAGLPIEN